MTQEQLDALPTTDKGQLIRVGHVTGLYFQIASSGTRTWTYRYTINGQRRLMKIGNYPYMPLLDAIEKVKEMRDVVRSERKDPLEQRKTVVAQHRSFITNLFGDV